MANIEKYIDKITVPSGNDTVTNHLVDTVSGYLKTIPYLTCTDTGGTVAKTTTLVSGVFTEDNLVDGAQVMVKFTNANTATAPTLSVNGTTAKLIKRYGAQSPSTSAATSWNNGSVVSLVYDGTYWQQVGFLNSTYSEISIDSITNGSGSGAGLITGRRAKSAVESFAPVKSVNGGTGDVIITLPTKTSDLTNDSGFITGAQVPSNETDPTVPAWAKASIKPSYTASEVGAPSKFEINITGEAGESNTYYIDQSYTDIISNIDAGNYVYLVDNFNFNNKVFPFVGYTYEMDSLAFSTTYIDGDVRFEGYVIPLSVVDDPVVQLMEESISIPHVPSAGTTATAVSTTASGGSATTWSKSDHVHSISSSTITSALGYTPYNSTNPSGYITASDVPSAGTSATAVGTTASGGSATTWSKSDHVHSINSATIISALGYTPYNSTNPSNYSSAIIRRWS